MSELPLTLAQPLLLEQPPRDTRPPAVAVLEDWLGEHAPKWRPDPQRDWLETWAAGVGVAPYELLEQAFTEAVACWESLTEPVRLLRALREARGPRAEAGLLWEELLLSAREAHRDAMSLALEHRVPVTRVRTWAVGGHYGCASDEVRFRGCGVVVRRLHRVTEDSRQAIGWPQGLAVPEGWRREGGFIRTHGGHWRRA